MVLGFFGSGGGSFSTVTVSTPSLHTAATFSVSAFSGSENFLMNFPTRRSIRRVKCFCWCSGGSSDVSSFSFSSSKLRFARNRAMNMSALLFTSGLGGGIIGDRGVIRGGVIGGGGGGGGGNAPGWII
ncbi:hypothetical protein DsansV1_C44g0240261 [Dioscorea sansibarensis]